VIGVVGWRLGVRGEGLGSRGEGSVVRVSDESSGSIPRRQIERGITWTDHSLVMARVRQNGESSLINSVISNQ